MIGFDALPPSGQAAALIGVVLLEAIVLYVAYGAFMNVVGPSVIRTIRGE